VAVQEFHVLQILFFRQIVVLLSALPQISKDIPGSLRLRRPGLHAVRLTGAFTTLSCSIWAVSVLPLTTATTLSFAHVFFVALAAAWFLGEPVGRHRIAAIVAGFTGVLLVIRPGLEGFAGPAALIPLLGAAGAASAKVAIRRLSQTESTGSLLFYQAVFIGLLAGVPMFWLWVTPDFEGFMLLVLMGVVAAGAQWAGIQALRLGEASVVGNIDYSQLIWAALFGYLLFSEVPDVPVIAGAAVIIGASVYVFHRERLQKSGT
jgi:drug/metabolite transporter (DMT)-like permease